MCNKCEIFHSKLLQNHKTYSLDKDISEIFTGFCKEKNHFNKLIFFCKNHNQLCCAECIANIEKKEFGKHKNCELCLIEEIKDEKKNKLKDNIKVLEEISNSLKDSINDLKKIFEKINEDKEELKNNIQKLFTKIRNELNNREDHLLIEVDKKFDELFFKENVLKESEKLPNEIKISLEKGKIKEKEENIDDLSSFINDCLSIESNINKIHSLNENMQKCNNFRNIKIIFFPNEEEEINKFIANIKSFGEVKIKNDFSNSSINDNNINKQEKIIQWIKEKIKKEKINFELLFKMSINGYSNKDFFNYCRNIGPSLILIKTKENKIFGGFTPLNFEEDKGNILDKSDQTFIFSLNLMKKYDMINKAKKAINCKNDYGPLF